MISLLKKKTPLEPLSPYHNFDEGPTVEVSIEGCEVSQGRLQEAFEIFANAVLGYTVEVEIHRPPIPEGGP